MNDSIVIIKQFEELISYKKEGTFIDLFVEALTAQGFVYQNNTSCRFFYEVGYRQQVVEIDWNVSDTVMHSLGLHSKYNTNYQSFEVEKKTLIIKDGEISIYLSEKV